jgi:tetratricopeptide (TPR) repeat protein
VIGHDVAALGRPRPRRGLAGKRHLLEPKARLVADHGPSAALALQAVTHSDARWFALNRKLKLPAAAGGASRIHESGSTW